MEEKTTVGTIPSDGLELFNRLSQYATSVSQSRWQKGKLFSFCVRASFSKCYEFNTSTWDDTQKGGAFFSLPVLRGICEEIILLNYVQHIPKVDRELLFCKLMAHEVHTRLDTQKAFFTAARPLQPILNPQMTQLEVQTVTNEIQTIWRAHGWPNMNRGTIPPIRDMAQKQGGDVLRTLYDYLYRLPSSSVHFSVGGLLRTGWGDKNSNSFSVRHFDAYYNLYGRIYGAFLFCVYFELFARILKPGEENQRIVGEIRNLIHSFPRWPEMITFEEMNHPVPDPGIIIRALGVVMAQNSTRLLQK